MSFNSTVNLFATLYSSRRGGSPSAALVLQGDAKLELEGDIGQILQLDNHWNSTDFQIGLAVRSNTHVIIYS